MGCYPGDRERFAWEKPVRQVKNAKGFWIGRKQVTEEAYPQVMGADPSR